MADTLTVIMAEDDEEVVALDFGTAPAGTSADQLFRLVNNSTIYTATAVQVSVEHTHLLVSVDEISFAATAVIGDLPAQGVSVPIWLRRTTPQAAPSAAISTQMHVRTLWAHPSSLTT